MNRVYKVLPIGILSAIAIVGIAYLSLSVDPMGGMSVHLFPHSDKVAHCLMYVGATIAFLLDYATYKLPHHTKLNVELAFTAAAMLLGLIMEIMQLTMHMGRSYDNLDIAANCLGALLGLALMRWKGFSVYRHTMLHSRHHRHKHHHGHNAE